MQIDGVPGQYWAMALVKSDGSHWKPCGCYHLSNEEALKSHVPIGERMSDLHWPTEIENGIIYIPHEDELK